MRKLCFGILVLFFSTYTSTFANQHIITKRIVRSDNQKTWAMFGNTSIIFVTGDDSYKYGIIIGVDEYINNDKNKPADKLSMKCGETTYLVTPGNFSPLCEVYKNHDAFLFVPVQHDGSQGTIQYFD